MVGERSPAEGSLNLVGSEAASSFWIREKQIALCNSLEVSRSASGQIGSKERGGLPQPTTEGRGQSLGPHMGTGTGDLEQMQPSGSCAQSSLGFLEMDMDRGAFIGL